MGVAISHDSIDSLPRGKGRGGGESEFALRMETKTFSKQTSNAASACEVNAIRVSPARSLGFPYSLPAVSLIYVI